MNPRKIIHIDMDCFYAAVEVRDRPELKGRPVAVGGPPNSRGVLTTANYEARKYGVKSAMPSSKAARLCPDLVFIRPNFAKYKKESSHVREIFRRYTDLIQPLSLDEAYLDVTGCELFDGVATKIAADIRKSIFSETQLTASAGIAPNKFLAKVASDWKKPNGQFTVAPSIVDQFVAELPVRKVPGVGPKAEEKLKLMGIVTCGDLRKFEVHELSQRFGKWGTRLFDLARGIDNRPVETGGQRKSLSVETTYSEDLETVHQVLQQAPDLFNELLRRLERPGMDTDYKSIYVKLKFNDFKQTTVETAAPELIGLDTVLPLIEEGFLRGKRPVRLLGMGVRFRTAPEDDESQLNLFD